MQHQYHASILKCITISTYIHVQRKEGGFIFIYFLKRGALILLARWARSSPLVGFFNKIKKL